MAVEVILDIYGSDVTYGVSHYLYDRAKRYVMVKGLTTGLDQYQVAGQAILAALPGFGGGDPFLHPANATLPLSRIVLSRWGPNKMRGVLDYSKRRSSSAPPNGQFISRKRGSYVALRWWRDGTQFDSDGLPSGDIFGISDYLQNRYDKDADVYSTMLTIPAVKIFVPRQLNFDPFNTVAFMLGKINANSVNFFGDILGARKLRFDSCDVDWTFNVFNNTATFDVAYAFTAIATGFWNQRAYFGAPIAGGGGVFPSQPPTGFPQWCTQKYLAHPEVNFTNFP